MGNDRKNNRGGKRGNYYNINTKGRLYIESKKSGENTEEIWDIYTTGGEIQIRDKLYKAKGGKLNIKKGTNVESNKIKKIYNIPGDLIITGDENQSKNNLYKISGSNINEGDMGLGYNPMTGIGNRNNNSTS